MDPNATLSTLALLLTGHLDPKYMDDCQRDMMSCVQDLYDWIQNGGFEPKWSNHPIAHGFYLGKTID